MHLFTHTRETVSLDGVWQAIPDAHRTFEERYLPRIDQFREMDPAELESEIDTDFPIDQEIVEDPPLDFDVDDGLPLRVPCSWATELPTYEQYEGWVWHTRRFEYDGDDDRGFLQFGAVNYAADVWLNGEHVGSHEGGFTPFSIEVTDHLREENFIAVRVDNERREDGLPTPNTDWFNFGGINRSVELVGVPASYLRNFKIDTAIDGDDVTVHVRAWTDGPQREAPELSIPGLGVEAALEPAGGGEDGLTEYAATLALSREDVDLWTPADPRLYDVELSCGGDAIDDRVGLRELGVVDGEIRLNGEPIELRGIAMHEEADGKGRVLDESDVDQRFRWLDRLGCNFARLAHYPHAEAMARRADREGILLWEEVPAYWGIAFGEEETRELYRQQLRELIQRDWSRASVALWSIANETNHEDDTRNRVLSEMVDYVRGLDDTRLVTAACFVNEADDGDRLVIRDPLVEDLDVIGINEYYGWYYGEPGAMARLEASETPVIVSEVGAGAKWGNHGPEDERWTEEFQAAIYREQLAALASVDRVRGLSPWILFDFRTPMRMNPHQRGYNRKGLLDESGRKKEAFDVLRDTYREWRE